MKWIAKSYCYTMWYDRSLMLWTLTRPGYQTMYYPPAILKAKPVLIFIIELGTNEKEQ